MSAACELHLFALMNQDPVGGLDFDDEHNGKYYVAAFTDLVPKLTQRKDGKARPGALLRAKIAWFGLGCLRTPRLSLNT